VHESSELRIQLKMTQTAQTDSRKIRPAEPRRERSQVRIIFVTNFCPHYRVKTFELLSQRLDAEFYFYSDGGEWYWEERHGTQRGDFSHTYLRGFRLLGTRIAPGLPWKLGLGRCDAIIKCIDGRFALAATYMMARLRRRPFILWTGVWSTIDTPFHRLAAPILRKIYRRASAIVVYGKHVKRYLASLGICEDKIFVAAHAVDNQAYSCHVSAKAIQDLREKLRLSLNDRVILYLGRLEESKGVSYLVEAFSGIADPAVLVIAGEGSQRRQLELLVAKRGLLDRVRFAGYVPPAQTPSYYAMAYTLVLPSVTTKCGKEPWGLVINESMNQGVPVIASDAVGAAAGGLVRNHVNGLVVPERDATGLAKAIRKLIRSPQIRDELSKNARKSISDWNNEKMVRGFERAVAYAVHKDDPLLTSS
jgi:glycosyltransferase involved in cell wall biosynthesis